MHIVIKEQNHILNIIVVLMDELPILFMLVHHQEVLWFMIDT